MFAFLKFASLSAISFALLSSPVKANATVNSAVDNIYEVEVKIGEVNGTATRDFKIGDIIKVYSRIGSNPEELGLVKESDNFVKLTDNTSSVLFQSPEFAKNIANEKQEKPSMFLQFDSAKKVFTTITNIKSDGDGDIEHLVGISLEPPISSHKNGSFIARVFNDKSKVEYYSVLGDIESIKTCDKTCIASANKLVGVNSGSFVEGDADENLVETAKSNYNWAVFIGIMTIIGLIGKGTSAKKDFDQAKKNKLDKLDK